MNDIVTDAHGPGTWQVHDGGGLVWIATKHLRASKSQ